MTNNTHFEFGRRLGAASLGADVSELNARLGQDAVMKSAAAAPFNRELCKMAAAAYKVDDDAHSPAAILFDNLSTAEEWDAGYDRFSDCVKRAMAKSAMLMGVAGGLHNSLGGNSLKALIATGALSGAGVGSLAFLLSRNAAQTSAENAEILEKVRAFKQLRRDIDEDMAEDELLASALPKGRERHRV
jgi:hypothetical protein